MKEVLLAFVIASLVSNLAAEPVITQSQGERARPAAFQCGRIGVIYLHPDEIYIEKQTLNPFTNKRFELDFELRELLESEFAAVLSETFGVEVVTSSDFGFRPILAYAPANYTSDIEFRKLSKRMKAMECCAVLLVRSSSRHSDLIGYESEGIAFIKSRLLHEKKPKTLFDARLSVQLFAPGYLRGPTRYDPRAIYGGKLQELEIDSEDWPTKRKLAEAFLDEHRSWLSIQLRQSIESIVEQL